ncbi:unnamed protein product, partial [Meganyctiphanes norvegica]
MTSTEDYVDEVLQELDEIASHVQSRKHLLNEFLDELRASIGNKTWCNLLQGVHYRFPGSSYEKVGVTDKTDYDVAMVLPQPYNGDNFEIVGTRHGAGLYKLKWSGDEDTPEFINTNEFLKVIDLRDSIFQQLKEVIEEVKDVRQDWHIRNKTQKASMLVIVNGRNGEFNIKMDLVPQIQVTRWDVTPNPPSDNELPSVLRDYVDQTPYPMFFTLASPAKSPKDTDSYAAPYHLNQENDNHLVVTCSFSELEKHCMKSSGMI